MGSSLLSTAHWECLCRIKLSLFKHQASNKQVCSGITEVSRQLRPGRVMQLGKRTVPMRAVMNFILCSGWSWQAHKKLLGSTWQTVVAHVSDSPHAYFHTPHPWGGNRMHGFIIAGHRTAHRECLCRIRLSPIKHQSSNKQVCSGITEVSRQLRPGRVMQLGK